MVWGATVALAVILSPLAPWLASRVWPCPWKVLSGIPCPFCGTTRAALLLARFEPWQSLVLYPLPTLAWSFFVIGGLAVGSWTLFGRPLPDWPEVSTALSSKRLGLALLLVVLANWIYSIATGV